jgi:methylmalonyl-CoA/ethylmalonyl-CoA epimerase
VSRSFATPAPAVIPPRGPTAKPAPALCATTDPDYDAIIIAHRDLSMIGRLNHVAIVVPDLAKGAAVYSGALGAKVSAPEAFPEHGVTVVFVDLGNTKIELLHPLYSTSPVAKFLERNPDGGMHHVCYEVEDILAARDRLKAQGARVLGDGEPRIGAHGKPVLFLHPKDFCGTLVEIEQV